MLKCGASDNREHRRKRCLHRCRRGPSRGGVADRLWLGVSAACRCSAISAFKARSVSAFFSESSKPPWSKAALAAPPASSWSRIASGIAGSLRQGIIGLLLSLYARPHTKFLTVRSEAIGPCAALLCSRILTDRPHPEQGFRACLDIVRLVRSFGRDRVEAACSRALDIGARTYGSVKSILANGLDQVAAASPASANPVEHSNIRGSRYYH